MPDGITALQAPHSPSQVESSPFGTPQQSSHELSSPSQTPHKSSAALPPHDPAQSSTLALQSQAKSESARSSTPKTVPAPILPASPVKVNAVSSVCTRPEKSSCTFTFKFGSNGLYVFAGLTTSLLPSI